MSTWLRFNRPSETEAGDASSEFDAFISYRRSDGSGTANWLRNAMQSFIPPRELSHLLERRVKVFLDTAYERGADDFYQRTILPALRRSRHLIVVATPNAISQGRNISDDWIAREISDFKDGSNPNNIIIVRGAGKFDDPLPGALDLVHPNAQIIDLRGATDWRPLHFSRRAFFDNEKLKIIATILDVPTSSIPTLRREDERRRQERIAFASTVAVAAIIGSSITAAYAIRAQAVGQQTLDRSLRSVESIIVNASDDHWNQALFDRSGNDIVRNTCNVLSQISIGASVERDRLTTLICDLERANAVPLRSKAAPEESTFADTEYGELSKSVSALQESESALVISSFDDLERQRLVADLSFYLIRSRNTYEGRSSFETLRSEISIALQASNDFQKRGKLLTREHPELAQLAFQFAAHWLDLASALFYNEIMENRGAEQTNSYIEFLEELYSLDRYAADLFSAGAGDSSIQSYRENVFLSLYLLDDFIRSKGQVVAEQDFYAMFDGAFLRLREDVREKYEDVFLLAIWWRGFQEISRHKESFNSEKRYSEYLTLFQEARKNAELFALRPTGSEYDVLLQDLSFEMHQTLDALRADALSKYNVGDWLKAKNMLNFEMRERRRLYEAFHDNSDWSRIYLLLGELWLSRMEDALGQINIAELRRRMAFLSLRNKSFDRSNLSSDQADSFSFLLSSISSDHHYHLDELRAKATDLERAGELDSSASILSQVQHDDREWDLLKPESDDFDRVYNLEQEGGPWGSSSGHPRIPSTSSA
jgi:hypothetical protein